MIVPGKKGFTIVELLITVGILASLVAAFYTMFKSSTDAWVRAESRIAKIQNGRVVLDQITRDVQSAFVGTSYSFSGVDNENLWDGDEDPDNLTFFCRIEPTNSNPEYSDMCEVFYYLDSDDKELRRRIKRKMCPILLK